MTSWCKRWFGVSRANFLVLPILLVSLGAAAAWHDGFFVPLRFIVTLAGVVLAHASVNLFNEYSDWRTGIDFDTRRTPFSGGSGLLPAGLVNPAHVRLAAWGALMVAGLCGASVIRYGGIPVVVYMVAGAIAVIGYTQGFARVGLGEPVSGVTLGSFVVLGTYAVQSGGVSTGVIWVSLSAGLLTMLLLLVNEFPDRDADQAHGRHTLVILLGSDRASLLTVVLLCAVYVVLFMGIVTGAVPRTVSMAFFTIPLAFGVAHGVVSHHANPSSLVPAQGMNVGVVLLTDLLMAVGYVLGR